MASVTLWYDYYHNKIITPFLVFNYSKQQIQKNLLVVVLSKVGYLYAIKKITMSRWHSESLQYPPKDLFFNELLFSK